MEITKNQQGFSTLSEADVNDLGLCQFNRPFSMNNQSIRNNASFIKTNETGEVCLEKSLHPPEMELFRPYIDSHGTDQPKNQGDAYSLDSQARDSVISFPPSENVPVQICPEQNSGNPIVHHWTLPEQNTGLVSSSPTVRAYFPPEYHRNPNNVEELHPNPYCVDFNEEQNANLKYPAYNYPYYAPVIPRDVGYGHLNYMANIMPIVKNEGNKQITQYNWNIHNGQQAVTLEHRIVRAIPLPMPSFLDAPLSIMPSMPTTQFKQEDETYPNRCVLAIQEQTHTNWQRPVEMLSTNLQLTLPSQSTHHIFAEHKEMHLASPFEQQFSYTVPQNSLASISLPNRIPSNVDPQKNLLYTETLTSNNQYEAHGFRNMQQFQIVPSFYQEAVGSTTGNIPPLFHYQQDEQIQQSHEPLDLQIQGQSAIPGEPIQENGSSLNQHIQENSAPHYQQISDPNEPVGLRFPENNISLGQQIHQYNEPSQGTQHNHEPLDKQIQHHSEPFEHQIQQSSVILGHQDIVRPRQEIQQSTSFSDQDIQQLRTPLYHMIEQLSDPFVQQTQQQRAPNDQQIQLHDEALAHQMAEQRSPLDQQIQLHIEPTVQQMEESCAVRAPLYQQTQQNNEPFVQQSQEQSAPLYQQILHHNELTDHQIEQNIAVCAPFDHQIQQHNHPFVQQIEPQIAPFDQQILQDHGPFVQQIQQLSDPLDQIQLKSEPPGQQFQQQSVVKCYKENAEVLEQQIQQNSELSGQQFQEFYSPLGQHIQRFDEQQIHQNLAQSGQVFDQLSAPLGEIADKSCETLAQEVHHICDSPSQKIHHNCEALSKNILKECEAPLKQIHEDCEVSCQQNNRDCESPIQQVQDPNKATQQQIHYRPIDQRTQDSRHIQIKRPQIRTKFVNQFKVLQTQFSSRITKVTRKSKGKRGNNSRAKFSTFSLGAVNKLVPSHPVHIKPRKILPAPPTQRSATVIISNTQKNQPVVKSRNENTRKMSVIIQNPQVIKVNSDFVDLDEFMKKNPKPVEDTANPKTNIQRNNRGDLKAIDRVSSSVYSAENDYWTPPDLPFGPIEFSPIRTKVPLPKEDKSIHDSPDGKHAVVIVGDSSHEVEEMCFEEGKEKEFNPLANFQQLMRHQLDGSDCSYHLHPCIHIEENEVITGNTTPIEIPFEAGLASLDVNENMLRAEKGIRSRPLILKQNELPIPAAESAWTNVLSKQENCILSQCGVEHEHSYGVRSQEKRSPEVSNAWKSAFEISTSTWAEFDKVVLKGNKSSSRPGHITRSNNGKKIRRNLFPDDGSFASQDSTMEDLNFSFESKAVSDELQDSMLQGYTGELFTTMVSADKESDLDISFETALTSTVEKKQNITKDENKNKKQKNWQMKEMENIKGFHLRHAIPSPIEARRKSIRLKDKRDNLKDLRKLTDIFEIVGKSSAARNFRFDEKRKRNQKYFSNLTTPVDLDYVEKKLKSGDCSAKEFLEYFQKIKAACADNWNVEDPLTRHADHLLKIVEKCLGHGDNFRHQPSEMLETVVFNREKSKIKRNLFSGRAVASRGKGRASGSKSQLAAEHPTWQAVEEIRDLRPKSRGSPKRLNSLVTFVKKLKGNTKPVEKTMPNEKIHVIIKTGDVGNMEAKIANNSIVAKGDDWKTKKTVINDRGDLDASLFCKMHVDDEVWPE